MAKERSERGGKPFQLRFTGGTGEYFKIWLINLLLTVVTFGVYYAWAKVRNKKFLYENTVLGGSAFEYRGQPMDIFKGWAIALVFVILYSIGTRISPESALLFAAAFIMLMPWIILKSLLYRARNSTYQGMHFRFNNNYSDAVRCYLLLPLLTVLSAGVLLPYMLYQQKKFLVENHYFGNVRFVFTATPLAFYRVALVAFTLMLAGGIAAPFIHSASATYQFLAPLEVAVVYAYAVAFFNAGITNLTYNSTTLRANSFQANLRGRDLFVLYLVHAFALVFSGGLLYPWVKLRMLKYRCKHTTFFAVDALERLAGQTVDKRTASGDEISEFIGFDFAL